MAGGHGRGIKPQCGGGGGGAAINAWQPIPDAIQGDVVLPPFDVTPITALPGTTPAGTTGSESGDNSGLPQGWDIAGTPGLSDWSLDPSSTFGLWPDQLDTSSSMPSGLPPYVSFSVPGITSSGLPSGFSPLGNSGRPSFPLSPATLQEMWSGGGGGQIDYGGVSFDSGADGSLGGDLVDPLTGNLHVAVNIDSLQNGQPNPSAPDAAWLPTALVYNSNTVNVIPIVQGTLADTGDGLASQLQAQLYWGNGNTPQGWVTYSTAGHSAGDTYLVDVQPNSQTAPITSSGVYGWTLEIKAPFPNNITRDKTISGQSLIVVNSASNDPVGPGWSIPGVDSLLSLPGGVLWIYGSGGARYFQNSGTGNTLINPPNDFGTMVSNLDNPGHTSWTYTSKNQIKKYFNHRRWARTTGGACPIRRRTKSRSISTAPASSPAKSTRTACRLRLLTTAAC